MIFGMMTVMKMSDFIKAKKSLGQNFCVDDRIPSEIIEKLQITPDKQIWEIGPGQGALTQKLVKYGADIHLFEIDERMKPILEGICDRLNITWGDFLELNSEDLPEVSKPLVVCGNLPYYCGTPIIKRFLEDGPKAERLVFLLQQEVAEKAAAKCGSKNYSFLSVHTAFFANAYVGNTYGPESFRPQPKINSSVLVLEPLELSSEEKKLRFNALKYASYLFNQRRKMALPLLRKNFSSKPWEELFEKLRIDFKARPENISPEQMIKLFNS